MDDLAYDIEQLWIEGHRPITIADILDCHIGLVYDWIASNHLKEESYDPYDTANS
jgi:DNA-binding CsgD family transcriptional regulator